MDRHHTFQNNPKNWTDFYGKIFTFREYYARIAEIYDIYKQFLRPNLEVLDVGCGTSLIASDLGSRCKMTCIDFCKSVIDQMSA